jgi:GTP-binding protein HflX
VASFHSTLVEAIEADVLLHVVDCADPDMARQMEAVEGVLEKILAGPRPTVLVFNKVDLLTDPDAEAGLRAAHPDSFRVSARTGHGLGELREWLWSRAAEHAAGTTRHA